MRRDRPRWYCGHCGEPAGYQGCYGRYGPLWNGMTVAQQEASTVAPCPNKPFDRDGWGFLCKKGHDCSKGERMAEFFDKEREEKLDTPSTGVVG